MIPFHIPTPQGCNIQTFYGPGASANSSQKTWNKPNGVSHVYMMLIGAGGAGNGVNGGGTGAVTVWYGAAQHVPNSLIVVVGKEGFNTAVSARFSNSAATPTALLTAPSAINIGSGSPGNESQFTMTGFFKSTSGQNGASGSQNAAGNTFLSGGSSNITTGNYGYAGKINNDGFFQMQPIIVGVGGSGSGNGNIGCGGGNGGLGGPGMVLIASW
jgi:hypothetical protein